MIKNHPKPFKSYEELEKHIVDVKALEGVADISHHDELFKLPAGQRLIDDETTDENLKMEEDAKIANALQEKLKHVREDKARDLQLTQKEEGITTSPVLTKRKRRQLAARKNGWDHDTFNQFAGSPPKKEKRKKRKIKEKPESPDDIPKLDLDKDDEGDAISDPALGDMLSPAMKSPDNPFSPHSHNLPGSP